MKKILVPTDFSACADKAITFAVESAKILSAEIVFLHALNIQGSLYTDYMGVTKEYNQALQNQFLHKLNSIKDIIENTEGIKAETIVSKNSLKNAIAEATDANDIDLIIMGTLGASRIKKVFFGSNASSVIGSSKIPVLVIPPDYEWKKPESFLFATHHFEKELRLLDFIFEIANLYMARVNAAIFSNEEKDTVETLLQRTNQIPDYEKFIRRNYEEPMFTTQHIFGKGFIESLQNYITENNVDVLTMVFHKRDFLQRIFNPSITRKMSYQTKIPLLAIPAGED
ncbi:MAG TPA: universal stress protein [Hanamia sp.]|nr:universal stress protein [Hanamia sp.]